MDRDGLPGRITFAEIVALEHARDRPFSGQPYQAGCPQLVGPPGIEQHFSFVGVQDLENLILIGFCVPQDLLSRKRRSRRVLAAGVTDHPREISDQKLDVMAQVLKLAQLVDHHRVPEMQVGRSRVQAELHSKWPPGFELFAQLGLDDQFIAAALDDFQLAIDVAHGCRWLTRRLFVRLF